jgi:hypothetical protein
MLGRIICIGKKQIKKSFSGSTDLLRRFNAIHLKELANPSHSNMPYPDFGHAASTMNTELYTKWSPMRFTSRNSGIIIDFNFIPQEKISRQEPKPKSRITQRRKERRKDLCAFAQVMIEN